MDFSKRSPMAVMAGGLVLAALIGCGGEETVASKSAAAFEEAQKRGETLGGGEHAHGHGAVSPGGGDGAPERVPAEDAHAGHAHGGAQPPAGGAARHDGPHGDHGAMEHGRRPAPGGHEGHGVMEHGGHSAAPSGPSPERREEAGHAGHQAGHGEMPREAPPAGAPAAGHAGHDAPAPAVATAAAPAPAPVAVPSEQPARTLRPDALDAPAATSVLDAQRSAEMAREMGGGHGGHGGHGSSTYRHVDAGRGPGAYQESEPQTPGAGPQHHDHGSAETLYVCPMHPEVTSKTPGTCPKCGMTLVERRKG